MGEFDGLIESLGPLMGMTPEQIADIKEKQARAEEKERVKYNMLVRLYKWAKKHDPKAFEEVMSNAAKAKEGN
jgi:hypothetical protein